MLTCTQFILIIVPELPRHPPDTPQGPAMDPPGTLGDLPMATSSIQVDKDLANLDPNSHTYTTDEILKIFEPSETQSLQASKLPPSAQASKPLSLKASKRQSPRRESRSENNLHRALRNSIGSHMGPIAREGFP